MKKYKNTKTGVVIVAETKLSGAWEEVKETKTTTKKEEAK
jgi:hypothetical protein